MFDSRPTECRCGGKVVYGRMQDFGLVPYQSGYCYYCMSCRKYVGTHQNRPQDALGELADGNTRRLRSICHEEFERHYYSTAGKQRAYYKLSKALGIKVDDCHFGYMQREMLNQSLEIMYGWGAYNAK